MFLRPSFAVETLDPLPERVEKVHRGLGFFLSDAAVVTLEDVREVIEFYDQDPDALISALLRRIRATFNSLEEDNVYIIAFMSLYESVNKDDEHHVEPLRADISALEYNLQQVDAELARLEEDMQGFRNWDEHKRRDEYLPIETDKLKYNDLFMKYNTAKGEKMRFEAELKEKMRMYGYFKDRRTVLIGALERCVKLLDQN